MPTSERADLKLMGFDGKCSARSQRTGDQCRRPAARGANVCPVHGGSAPQVKAAARRRLDQAADVLVQRLLKFALDGDVADNVALTAIRDALDRAGMGAKTEVAVEVKPAYEELLGDVAHTTKAQWEAMKRGDTAPADPPRALHSPPERDTADVIDAEVVEDTPESPSPGRSRPSWAEDADAAAQSARGQLVPLEQAAAEVAAANRASRVSQARRKRR
ncbi:hypothetical protein LAUMK41_00489 [Mycobacterium attenuatum]|nr:hypothetical protein LAUMK41_00489 [Mycobacterium attenuatum]